MRLRNLRKLSMGAAALRACVTRGQWETGLSITILGSSMKLSPAEQRYPRLTRLLPAGAHILWYVMALVVGYALRRGPFDCTHAMLPCAISRPFSSVFAAAGTLGVIAVIGYGISMLWVSVAGNAAVVAPYLKAWFHIACTLINPIVYAIAVAFGIAMFAVHQLWFAFAFVFGGGLGIFMQMPALTSLIREFSD